MGLCARVLAEGGEVRTLTGDQRLTRSFFYHGDLIGGGLTARAVDTDGGMSVAGALAADVDAELHLELGIWGQGYGDGVQEALCELLVDDVFTLDDGEPPPPVRPSPPTRARVPASA